MCDTQAPRVTKASADSDCTTSSRVISRTRTLVSIARMPFPYRGAHPLFEFRNRPRRGLLAREQSLVQLLGRVLARAAHDDMVALLLPFQYGTGGESQLPPNLCGYRDLPLCGQLGGGESHG